jgi:hypothetical protein
MSEPTESPLPTGEVPPADEGVMLQFDQAEFTTPVADRPACTVCKQPIVEEYFEIGGKVLCPRCRYGVEASFQAGSRTARFFKALAFGLIAAAIGAVIYYASVRITNINSALVSILIGFMVGAAVRKGTGNRGGRLYQLLAVFLTYSSIVAMHVAFVIDPFLERPARPRPHRAAGEKPDPGKVRGKAPDAPKQDVGPDAGDIRPAAEDGARKDATPDPGQPIAAKDVGRPNGQPQDGPPIVLRFSLLAQLVGFLYTIPVRVAIRAPISGLIFAFALWEAWKINKPFQFVFSGPFRLGASGGAQVEAEGAADGS